MCGFSFYVNLSSFYMKHVNGGIDRSSERTCFNLLNTK